MNEVVKLPSVRASLAHLEKLPKAVHAKLTKLNTLDKSLEDVKEKVDGLVNTLRSEGNAEENLPRREKLAKLQRLLKDGEKLSDEKVALADALYEIVDKHITDFDDLIESYHADIGTPGKHEEEVKTPPIKRKKKLSKKSGIKSESPCGKPQPSSLQRFLRDKTRCKEEPQLPLVSSGVAAPISLALALSGDRNPPEIVDMPVDPNEPVYCTCQQISFGEMVACDNPNCLYEWFHFACVGLTDKPTGEWFCPQCEDPKKRIHT